MKYKAGDEVTFVLDDQRAKGLNEHSVPRIIFGPEDITAHKPKADLLETALQELKPPISDYRNSMILIIQYLREQEGK